MTEDSNLSVMRRTLEAFQERDAIALSQVFADDVVWHVPGKSFLAKEYRGKEEVFGFFQSLLEETDGTLHHESIDMLTSDTGGVFVNRVKATRGRKTLDLPELVKVSIRNDLIVEGSDYFYQEHEWDAFWS